MSSPGAELSFNPPMANSLRHVWFNYSEAIKTPVYERKNLLSGQSFEGPAVIEQLDAMTVVHPGDKVEIDPFGNLIIEIV
jgi:N-methylhydantoinase A